MAFESEDGGGGGGRDGGKKMRRVDEQGDQRKEEASQVDHISALPDDLRRRILTYLPLKDAIRSGELAKGWRDLWKSRWSEAETSCLDVDIGPGDKPVQKVREVESFKNRHLDRFSLVVDNQRFRDQHLKRLLKYAAERQVVGLQIDLRCCKTGETFYFHLPRSSPLLAHLSLRNINISDYYFYKCDDGNAKPFSALEVIRLYSVSGNVNPTRVLELCPRLRILAMHRCIFCVFRLPPCCLRSLRYSGDYSCYPYLPRCGPLADLYISLREPIRPNRWRATIENDLSSLTVLTVCSNALRVVASSLLNDGPNYQWDKMSKLPSLKELQLLMRGMKMQNLADIYVLLKSCDFSNLERVFVQLPGTSSDVPLMDLVEEVSAELPGDSLVKLGMVKVMNFNWRRFEVQLVSVLLRKATSLHKVLLVSPNVDPLHVPGVQEADLLILKKALSSGRIIVSESDDPEIQPFHHEVFMDE